MGNALTSSKKTRQHNMQRACFDLFIGKTFKGITLEFAVAQGKKLKENREIWQIIC
jgi:hypothetical protein